MAGREHWMFEKSLNVAEPRRIVLLAMAFQFLLLLLWVAKPVHVDDVVFLRITDQILAHPLDPYGFAYNWFGLNQPIIDIHRIPPLQNYFLALGRLVSGSSLPLLHVFAAIPAVLTVLGVASLARDFKKDQGQESERERPPLASGSR